MKHCYRINKPKEHYYRFKRLFWSHKHYFSLVSLLYLYIVIIPIICFLDRPFIVIWMCGLCLGFSFTMLLTLSIWFVFKAKKDSLILSTSDILVGCLEAWAYDLVGFARLDLVLISLKYFEIVLNLLLDLAGSGGRGDAFSIEVGTSLAISFLLLFLLGMALGVNLEKIFALRVLVLLSVWKESYLASYIDEINFQMASLMPSKSLRSFILVLLTYL